MADEKISDGGSNENSRSEFLQRLLKIASGTSVEMKGLETEIDFHGKEETGGTERRSLEQVEEDIKKTVTQVLSETLENFGYKLTEGTILKKDQKGNYYLYNPKAEGKTAGIGLDKVSCADAKFSSEDIINKIIKGKEITTDDFLPPREELNPQYNTAAWEILELIEQIKK